MEDGVGGGSSRVRRGTGVCWRCWRAGLFEIGAGTGLPKKRLLGRGGPRTRRKGLTVFLLALSIPLAGLLLWVPHPRKGRPSFVAIRFQKTTTEWRTTQKDGAKAPWACKVQFLRGPNDDSVICDLDRKGKRGFCKIDKKGKKAKSSRRQGARRYPRDHPWTLSWERTRELGRTRVASRHGHLGQARSKPCNCIFREMLFSQVPTAKAATAKFPVQRSAATNSTHNHPAQWHQPRQSDQQHNFPPFSFLGNPISNDVLYVSTFKVSVQLLLSSDYLYSLRYDRRRRGRKKTNAQIL